LADARNVIVAGAGIGGLTAALALSRAGFRVTVLEQAPQLEEIGAGLQLSPNATRVLIELGLAERLKVTLVEPQAIRIMSGPSAREIVRIPLGAFAEQRYGAPYWVMHRGDLQLALANAARINPDITLRLGTRVEDYAATRGGIRVRARFAGEAVEEHGIALVGADGVWSAVREQLRRRGGAARFQHKTAWRALVPADRLAEQWRQPMVHLWLGMDSHLVHYPVKGGALINIVAIVDDEWNLPGWSASGDPAEVLRRFARWSWAEAARAIVATPKRWQRWALFDRGGPRGGSGAVTLLGDAAHPMLPFFAQGGGMAIEDAAVLASCLMENPERPARAFRAYEKARRKRVQNVQDLARKQGRIYGMTGPEALARNLVMRWRGGEKLLARYDWIYEWTPPPFEFTGRYVRQSGKGRMEDA
jgi:salicylate hydroxylase